MKLHSPWRGSLGRDEAAQRGQAWDSLPLLRGKLNPSWPSKSVLKCPVQRRDFFSVPFYRRKNWSSEWLNALLKVVWSRNRYNFMALNSDRELIHKARRAQGTPSSFPLRQTLSVRNLSRFFRLAPKLIKVSFPNCTIKINYVHKLEGKEIACTFWVPW